MEYNQSTRFEDYLAQVAPSEADAQNPTNPAADPAIDVPVAEPVTNPEPPAAA